MDFFTVNPASGEKIKTYNYHSESEVEQVISSLRESSLRFRFTSMEQRRTLLTHLTEELSSKREELAVQINKEMGKLLEEALAEIDKSILALRYYGGKIDQWLMVQTVQENDFRGEVRLEPLGLVFAIMPWNFPLWQFIRCAAPAWMVGNLVLLKPSDITIGVSEFIWEVVNASARKAGFEDDVLGLIRVPHTMTERIVSDRRINFISFTGSIQGGSQVAALAGKYLKKSTMELGGSDAYLILKDANLSKAVEACAKSRLINSGQSCISAKRFFVHEDHYSKFIQSMANVFEGRSIAPLAHARFSEQLKKQVEQCQGKVIYKGKCLNTAGGAYFPPTIIEMDNQVGELWDQEFFGPVACVWKFTQEEGEESAVQKSNHSIFGLGGAVFSEDENRAKKLALQLECGMVSINDMVRSDVRVPFGGVKSSGYGRELSSYGIQELANIKVYF